MKYGHSAARVAAEINHEAEALGYTIKLGRAHYDVKRRNYIIMKRHRLQYLNEIERIHCIYSSYATGFIVYAQEIAARTQQYWPPIKHAEHPIPNHSRYHNFTPYGDVALSRRNKKILKIAKLFY